MTEGRIGRTQATIFPSNQCAGMTIIVCWLRVLTASAKLDLSPIVLSGLWMHILGIVDLVMILITIR